MTKKEFLEKTKELKGTTKQLNLVMKFTDKTNPCILSMLIASIYMNDDEGEDSIVLYNISKGKIPYSYKSMMKQLEDIPDDCNIKISCSISLDNKTIELVIKNYDIKSTLAIKDNEYAYINIEVDHADKYYWY